MRYCHDCGAECASDDVFCSFCGITLQAIPLASTEENSANVSTDELANQPTATAEISNHTDLAIQAAIRNSSSNLEIPSAIIQPLTGQPIEPSKLPSESANLANAKTAEPGNTAPPAPLPNADETPVGVELETMFGYPAPEKTPDKVVENPVETLIETQSAKLTEESTLETPLKSFTETMPANADENILPRLKQNELAQLETTAAEPQLDSQIQPAEKSAEIVSEISDKTPQIFPDEIIEEDLQPTLIGQNADFLTKTDYAPVLFEPHNSELIAEKAAETISETISTEPPTIIGGDAKPFVPVATTAPEAQNFIPSIPSIENFAVPPPVPAVQEQPIIAPPVLTTDENMGAKEPRPTGINRSQETPGGKAAKLKPLDETTVLNNRYEIVRRIGGGGMGAVYLAKDRNLGGTLRAVKEMIQAYVDENQQEKAVQDFKRESVLLTQLEHNSIPTIYDYFYDEPNGRFYLVMKYISGGDLAARLKAAPEGKLDEGSVGEWAMQIADVLEYLHRREPPIVYRDLKPSNIMLDPNGKAMLIDFGIARWVNKEEKGVTAVGTMGYAPPELFAGNAEPGSDIYSLGATMFHLLTGADPQSNPLLIFDFTKNPRPRQINPMLSVEMEDILLRAVEYNAGLRFESAAKMRDAIGQHLEKLKNGRLTFERTQHNLAQVMPIPAQAPPPVPFEQQPQINMVFCGFCGEKIIASDMFCAYCGAPQGSLPPGQQPPQMMQTMMPGNFQPPTQTGATTARLVVLGTNELDPPLFNLEKENNLVGREDRRANIFPEIDLTRYDRKAQVSRRHARIWREGESFLVEDLKSSNGTILIGDDNQTVRLQANQPHVLQHGDKIKLGDTTLRFYVN